MPTTTNYGNFRRRTTVTRSGYYGRVQAAAQQRAAARQRWEERRKEGQARAKGASRSPS